jgi:hypothetical protein
LRSLDVPTVKEQVRELADQLSDSATWDDVAAEVELRRRVLRGLADKEAGRVHTVAEVRRRLGLDA